MQGYEGASKWANVDRERLYLAASPDDDASDVLECGDARNARLVITVSDVDGADPGVTVVVQGRQDAADDWEDQYTGTELTEDGVLRTSIFPLRFMRVTATLTGEDGGDVGEVTQTVGTGPGFTISGTPLLTGTLTVTISTGGAPGTAEFDWDLDTESATGVAIPTTPFQVVLTDTGLTLTFEDDAFVEADEFEAEITESAPDTSASIDAQITLARKQGPQEQR